MLHTLEIPRHRWPRFLDLVNRILDQRPIRIEVMGRSLGDQSMAALLPFHGLDYDRRGRELSIHVGFDRGVLTHRIVGPTRIYIAQNDIGEVEWLAIEEVGEIGDAVTLLHFEHIPELQADYEEVASGNRDE
jgi:hypothetical protein